MPAVGRVVKRYLIQTVDADGKVLRTRGFRTRFDRDCALLATYRLSHGGREPRRAAEVRLRDPDGYEARDTA